MTEAVAVPDGAPAPKVAVIVRCHRSSAKLLHLIQSLARDGPFDLFVSPNETDGPIDVGPYRKLPYRVKDNAALGFNSEEPGFIAQCSDVLFEHCRRLIPDYDFYILIEYDVGLTRPDGAFLAELSKLLGSAEFRDVDLVGSISSRQPGWSHYANAAKYFQDIVVVFFPFVVLSERAIRRLHELRLRLEGSDLPYAERVHCEPFVACGVAQAGFRSLDLNELRPGSYDRSSYFWGFPMLLEGPETFNHVEILHPVYSGAEFLDFHFYQAEQMGTLPQFFSAIEDLTPPLAPADAAFGVWRGRVVLRAHRQAAGDVPPPPPLADPLPVLLVAPGLLHDGDGQDLQEAMTAAATHLVDDFIAQGCRQFGLACAALDESVQALSAHIKQMGAEPLILQMDAGPSFLEVVREANRAFGRRPFLLARMDFVARVSLQSLLAFHLAHSRSATAVIARPSTLLLALAGQIPKVLDQLPRSGEFWVESGLLLIEPELEDHIDAGASSWAVLNSLRASGELEDFEHQGFWHPTRTPRDRKLLQRLVSEEDAELRVL